MKGGGGSEERRYGRWGMGGNLSCPSSFQSYFFEDGWYGGYKKKVGEGGGEDAGTVFSLFLA